MKKVRCPWVGDDLLMQEYHDEEWGRGGITDDKTWFEFLVLESFQAGLSWKTILHKRENFRKAFDNFDFIKIASYSDDKVAELMNDSSIIRNQKKIGATINNAKVFVEIISEFGSFANFMHLFVDKQIVNKWDSLEQIPSSTPLSKKISDEMKKRGIKFFGPTTCYAFMQATGLVDDHLNSCFCKN